MSSGLPSFRRSIPQNSSLFLGSARAFGGVTSIGLGMVFELVNLARRVLLMPLGLTGAFRRGGITSMLFGAAKLSAIAIAALLIFDRSYLEAVAPAWRESYGYAALLTAGLALFATVMRFCSDAMRCFFWLGVFGVIGSGVFSDNPGVFSQAPVASANATTSSDDWVDMFSNVSVPARAVAQAERRAMDTFHPLRAVQSAISAPVERMGATFDSFTSGITDIFGFDAIGRSMSSGVAGLESAVLQPLGLSAGSSDMLSFSSSGALPDSAYFAKPFHASYKIGSGSGGLSGSLMKGFGGQAGSALGVVERFIGR